MNTTAVIEKGYEWARECYARFGVSVEQALQTLRQVSISLHCWQGDDVGGFENDEGLTGGGIQATGNYPGKARNADELRADLEKTLSLIPGRHRLNLHAIYAETHGRKIERDQLAPEHFATWIDWAKSHKLGMDFNGTFFSHPKANDGFTLSSRDEGVRRFWVTHGIACRKISEKFGRELGTPCVTNVWIPDGFKDIPIDRKTPRAILKRSLDEVFAEKLDPRFHLDAVESKLFGLGSESYVVGSHEFYLGYAIENRKLICLDAGHYHPTESIADKISSVLTYLDEILLHVSRGVRWDSDHVVILNDDLRAIAEEIVRGDFLGRVHIGLDFFDASINRVAAWVIGTRCMLKALLLALLEPTQTLRDMEKSGDYTGRLALLEELKTLPFGAIWDYYCLQQNVPIGPAWIEEVRTYERDILRGADRGETVNVLLRATKISKSFAGVHALKHVSFELRGGEVHALVGENGAGKSTLIKIITGAHEADDGTLEVNGRLVEKNSPVLSWQLGIAAIYQQPALFPDLSVAENIALGLEPRGAWRRIRWGERRRRARDLLARIGATIDPDVVVSDLTMPEQQFVEIARTLGAKARILIMDEPTASLSEREVERLMRVIRELREQGVGIIYISHRLEELSQIADRVTILRDGCVVGARPMADIQREELIRLMVGREMTAVFPKQPVPLGDRVLELYRVGCRAVDIGGVSFNVRAGEILGLAGLVGAGRTELARILFGLTPADAGEIRLRGQPVVIDSPARAVELGIAYVPEDRRRHGVILEMPITANTSLAILKKISTFGWLNFARERTIAESFVKRLAIKTASIEAPAGELSGGNQQKVAVARWLAAEPAVLILDEPTQGVDVGAKAEIHRLMSELAARGLAIVMISSELPEILGMSDRIAVMHAGTVVAFLDRAEATQEKVLALALGHSLNGECGMGNGT